MTAGDLRLSSSVEEMVHGYVSAELRKEHFAKEGTRNLIVHVPMVSSTQQSNAVMGMTRYELKNNMPSLQFVRSVVCTHA